MEIIKRKIGYQDLGVTPNLTFTATTFYFPLFLTQSYEDIGIYTDVKDSLADVVTGFTSAWNLSYDGSLQKDCKTSNKCLVTNTVSPATFYNASDGSLNVVITNQNTLDCPSPITINWTGPDGFVSSNLNNNNLKAGSYTLKITDANCDRTIKTYNIGQPGPLDSEIGINNSQVNDTNGTCSGSATVTVTGGRPPYTFAWYSAGTTTPVLGTSITLTNICIGDYYVVITDSDGTVVTEFFNISQPPPLSGIVKTVINIDCQGNSGEIKVQGIGGYITNGYSYTLNGVTNNTGIFDSNITTQATYNVIITDNGSSTFTLPVVITQPITPIQINFSSTSNSFNDGIDGDISTDPTGQLTFSVTGGQSFPCPSTPSSACYNVSIESIFKVGAGYGSFENSSVSSGDYVVANSSTFYTLPSGWYRVTASDNECEATLDTYIDHQFTSSVDISSTSTPGQLRADISNVSGFNWLTIKWSDGAQIACPGALVGTPCVSITSLPSNTHQPGTEITLEVVWVDSSAPTNQLFWRSFKRAFKIP
jgi:uncharacterized protein (DUF2141 family)